MIVVVAVVVVVVAVDCWPRPSKPLKTAPVVVSSNLELDLWLDYWYCCHYLGRCWLVILNQPRLDSPDCRLDL